MSNPALRAIHLRMLDADPFTYGELCAIAGRHGSFERDDRLCDKTIQKWRRKGWIHHWRDGKATLWTMTELGRAEAQPEGSTP